MTNSVQTEVRDKLKEKGCGGEGTHSLESDCGLNSRYWPENQGQDAGDENSITIHSLLLSWLAEQAVFLGQKETGCRLC